MSTRNAGHQANPEHRREQICRKELSDNTAAQADDHSPLIRIAPAQLPESYRATALSGYSGIVIRIGEAASPAVFGYSHTCSYYIACGYTDMRKQIDGPCAGAVWRDDQRK